MTNQRGFPKGVRRSSDPISRVPGGDRVAVRVGVVQMGMGNDCAVVVHGVATNWAEKYRM